MNTNNQQQGWLPKNRYEVRNIAQGVSEHASQDTTLTIMSFERANGLRFGAIEKLCGENRSPIEVDRTIKEIVQGPETLDEACRASVSAIKKRQESAASFLVQWFQDSQGRFHEETYLPDKNGELKLVKRIPMYPCT